MYHTSPHTSNILTNFTVSMEDEHAYAMLAPLEGSIHTASHPHLYSRHRTFPSSSHTTILKIFILTAPILTTPTA